MDSLGIAIDGGRYVRIDSRIGALPRNVRLRTLSASQSTARLDFCRFKRKGRVVVESRRITGLTGKPNVPAELKLRIERRTFALWEVRISRSGGPEETVKIRTRAGLWPLFMVLALLLAGALWLLLASPASPYPSRTSSGSSPVSRVAADIREETPSSSDISPPPASEAAPDGLPAENLDKVSVSEAEERSGEEDTAAEGTDIEASADGPPVEDDSITELTQIPDPAPLTIYFLPESARLSGPARQELEKFSESVPAGRSVIIEGHSALYGTERGQKALSLLRAQNISGYIRPLLPDGVSVETAGRGVEEPATRDPEAQERNRRAVVRLLERIE